MPHIMLKVARAIEHVEEMGDENMFFMPKTDAMESLRALQAKGHMFVPTEGCTTFDPMQGCQCGNPTVTAKLITEENFNI